jgi:hypothetical protein
LCTHGLNYSWNPTSGRIKNVATKRCLEIKDANAVLRKAANRLYEGALDFQIAASFHGTHVHLISFTPKKYGHICVDFHGTDNCLTALCADVLHTTGFHPNRKRNVERLETFTSGSKL